MEGGCDVQRPRCVVFVSARLHVLCARCEVLVFFEIPVFFQNNELFQRYTMCPTAGAGTCCPFVVRNVNSTPHRSHFLVFHSTHFNVTLTLAQEQGVWRVFHTCVIFMRSWCGCLDTLYDSPFYSMLSIFSLIFLFHSPVLHLLLSV